MYIIGMVIALPGFFNLYKALKRRSWPETIGKIQKNEVSKITSHTNYWFNSGLFSKKSARPIEDSGKEKELWLSYVYVVDGYKYIGNQLYSAPIVKVKNQIFGIVEGDKIKVFYNPKKPNVAFLAHSFAWPSVLVVVLGVVAALLGYYIELNA